ncbi:hypothetical protein QVD17_24801 [Tagetes erecta]|uniref:Uncharacterized protein n=1 Tax=Tagetes erecta TaxID=13708 RepID=A0AAD8KI66_TARER|nr:hypothetical protein QVD17_24801 [Tagetes erecta]
MEADDLVNRELQNTPGEIPPTVRTEEDEQLSRGLKGSKVPMCMENNMVAESVAAEDLSGNGPDTHVSHARNFVSKDLESGPVVGLGKIREECGSSDLRIGVNQMEQIDSFNMAHQSNKGHNNTIDLAKEYLKEKEKHKKSIPYYHPPKSMQSSKGHPISMKLKDRCFDSWLKKPGFVELVSKAYTDCQAVGPPDRVFMLKLKAVKVAIKEWRKKIKEEEIGKLLVLKSKIENIERIAEERLLEEHEQRDRVSWSRELLELEEAKL